MKKAEFKLLDSKLIDAHGKTQTAWALVRVLVHAVQSSEPPPAWALRDTCSAIEDNLLEISDLLMECGIKIEGEL